MRREQFTLEVWDVDWVDEGGDPEEPTVAITFEGPADELRERLTDADGDLLAAGETDVAFRLLDEMDDEGAAGVVSVTNRITGDFVLELNEHARNVLRFIRAARRYGEQSNDEGEYRVVLRIDDEELVTYEKNTFLVYNPDGELLRKHSLIPSGVEL